MQEVKSSQVEEIEEKIQLIKFRFVPEIKLGVFIESNMKLFHRIQSLVAWDVCAW